MRSGQQDAVGWGGAETLLAALPADAVIAVISRGDDALVKRFGARAWHFPRLADGAWAGYYPQHDTAAIAQLEAARAGGAQFLVVPESSAWWLDHYRGLTRLLESRYRAAGVIADATGPCRLFDLRIADRSAWPEALANAIHAFWVARARLPTVVDWDTGHDLATTFPHVPVFSPPRADEALPYIDGSVDFVAFSGDDRRDEALRVAAAAVVQSGRSIDWLGSTPPAAAPSVTLVCRLDGRDAEPLVRTLCDTLPESAELIVILGGSGPADSLVIEDQRVRTLRATRPPSHAEDCLRAAASATREVIVFVDDHATLLPGWATAVVRTLTERPACAAVVGRRLCLDGLRDHALTADRGWHRHLDAPLFDAVRPTSYADRGLLATRRSLFLELGGLDEDADAPDQPDWSAYLAKLEQRELRAYEHPEVAAVALRTSSAPRMPAARATPASRHRDSGSGGRALVIGAGAPVDHYDGTPSRLLDHVQALIDAEWSVAFLCVNGAPEPGAAQPLLDRGATVFEPSGAWLEEILGGTPLEVAIIEGWPLAEVYIPVLRSASPCTRIAVDAPSLQLLRDARRTFGGLDAQGVPALLDGEYADAVLGELNVYAAADAVLTGTTRDAELVDDLTGRRGLAREVPPVAEPVAGRTFADRRGILVVGDGHHAPDAEAIDLLFGVLGELDDTLLAEHPIWPVGAGLAELLSQATPQRARFRATGAVPSLDPYLASARVLVALPAYGAGAQATVASALRAGLPVISMEAGVERLGLRDGEQVLLGKDPQALMSAIARALTEPDLWERLAQMGVAHAAARHDRRHVGAMLLAALQVAAARPRAPALLPTPDDDRLTRWRRQVAAGAVSGPIRTTLRRLLPPDAVVAVVNDGSTELLRLTPGPSWPFPQGDDGRHTEYCPHDSCELLEQLDALRVRGADHLLLPRPQQWWLNYYPEFRDSLRERYRILADDQHCLLFSLTEVHKQARNQAPARPTAGANGAARSLPAKLIAFYLPQFHPIAENDEWWGSGFTEWTNVGKADPLFAGHEQPHVPGELGFYDLRLSETRAAQADLAREHDLHAFCYYHYWFDGRLLLERPFNEVLASGEPDFPFCLCWANEPWSRRWDGSPHEMLQDQRYSREDDLAHIAWLLPALSDPRAVCVDGKPVFLVYRARSLPDPARTADTWRREVRRAGLPGIHLVAVETARDPGWDATSLGFDAKLHFAPQFGLLRALPQLDLNGHHPGPRIYDYAAVSPILSDPEPVPYIRYETVCPRWDNTPRAGRAGLVLHDASPEAYRRWLVSAIERAQRRPADQRLVFVNAWNEWGEGCHLEPDVAHGRAYLEATREALATAGAASPGARTRLTGAAR